MFQAEQATWTLHQLCTLAASELSRRGAGHLGTDVPLAIHIRNVRYYMFLGMLDRPVGYHRGSARFGKRHLVQLLAIRSLQSQGLCLSAIQLRMRTLTLVEQARLSEEIRTDPAGFRRPPARRVDSDLPIPHLPLVTEDRAAALDWLRLVRRGDMTRDFAVIPRPCTN